MKRITLSPPTIPAWTFKADAYWAYEGVLNNGSIDLIINNIIGDDNDMFFCYELGDEAYYEANFNIGTQHLKRKL